MTGHLDSATTLDAVPQPYLDDGDVQLYHGDVINTLRSLPAGIAQTCVTSPPYWGLRDYGTGEWTGGDEACDHSRHIDYGKKQDTSAGSIRGGPMRDVCSICGARRVDQQLGLEPTPELYVERLVEVFREVWRVLRDDGTCWINIGDSYLSGQGGRQSAAGELPSTSRFDRPDPKPRPDLPNAPSGCAERAVTRRTYLGADSGLKPKDLAGIPWMLAFALRADGWYLRSDIVWSKPNPMPESVVDRPTKAHEYLFLLSKRPRYFYDADAIREPHAVPLHAPGNQKWPTGDRNDGDRMAAVWGNEAGRNRRSVWTIPTEPFPEAHFATYPQALVRPCILAGTSERGECVECGAPRVRETAMDYEEIPGGSQSHNHTSPKGAAGMARPSLPRLNKRVETTGWSASCACDAPTRPQTVLDPFVGSGTTALVARNHGRRALGIDLSAEYLAIAAKRLQQLSLLGGTT